MAAVGGGGGIGRRESASERGSKRESGWREGWREGERETEVDNEKLGNSSPPMGVVTVLNVMRYILELEDRHVDAGLHFEGTADPSEGTATCSDQEVDAFGPDRLRKGETVLRARTSRILLVLEQCHDSFNHQVAPQHAA